MIAIRPIFDSSFHPSEGAFGIEIGTEPFDYSLAEGERHYDFPAPIKSPISSIFITAFTAFDPLQPIVESFKVRKTLSFPHP